MTYRVSECVSVKHGQTYVVTIEILDQSNDVHGQSIDQCPDLLGLPGGSEEIDHLLNSTGSVHVERNTDQIAGDRFDNGSPLFIRRVFK